MLGSAQTDRKPTTVFWGPPCVTILEDELKKIKYLHYQNQLHLVCCCKRLTNDLPVDIWENKTNKSLFASFRWSHVGKCHHLHWDLQQTDKSCIYFGLELQGMNDILTYIAAKFNFLKQWKIILVNVLHLSSGQAGVQPNKFVQKISTLCI